MFIASALLFGLQTSAAPIFTGLFSGGSKAATQAAEAATETAQKGVAAAATKADKAGVQHVMNSKGNVKLDWNGNPQKRLGGNSADFAQSYVLAHELGHHVQNILGIEQKAQQMMQDRSQRSRASVELELQADCFAGVWGHSMQERGKLDPNDLQSALANAAAVGDDHIQKMQRGTVSPESCTHGTSAERQGWFSRGMT